MKYPSDIMSEVLFTEEQIVNKAKELAEKINKDYQNKPLTVVCTLKGAIYFFADLMKHIDIDCQFEFIKASSYIGNTTMTIGNVQITNVMNFPIEDRDILIVEDIIDTGRTLKDIYNLLKTRNPLSLRVITLLDKPDRRVVEFTPDYTLFTIPDHFVIGYGLDCGELYRTLPYIAEYNQDI